MSASLESLMRSAATPAQSAAELRRLLWFIAVGGGAALAFVVLSSVAIAALPASPRWIVASVCYAALVVPVYLLHRRFSFSSDAPHGRALPRYVAVQLCAIALASLFGYVAYGVLGLPTVAAALLVSGLTAGVNFIILRAWAFA
ncbi:MAG: GtrA family protein [Devosia sp.]